MIDSKVHVPGDGRGNRMVRLDGKPIFNCVYANERKGKVRVIPLPIRLHKHRKRVITRTLYGEVKVTPLLMMGES